MAIAKIEVLRNLDTIEIRIKIQALGDEFKAALELANEMQEHEDDLAELVQLKAQEGNDAA